MELLLDVSVQDIHRLSMFVSKQNNAFIDHRRIRNVERKGIVLDFDTIIWGITMGLLTSQQRVGPGTPVTTFLSLRPFPFTSQSLSESGYSKDFVRQILFDNKIKRFLNKIPSFLIQNVMELERLGEWHLFESQLRTLTTNQSQKLERITAGVVQDKFIGFGPKQARNFLQALGLTQFEIPLDSRVTNWLREFGFPIPVTGSALQDKDYYHFVMDNIHVLCESAGILPCMLDAAIFSSLEPDGWSIEHLPY